MTLVTRPAMVDDSGLFTDGTVVNKAFIDAAYDQMDDQGHSSTNPTVKPKAVTDEVVAARGSKASLDARLDISLNEDGTLKTQSSLVSVSQLQTFSEINFWDDSCFDVWAGGDSAEPSGWTLTGAGATIARAGSGGASFEASPPGDTTQLAHGRFCAKVTNGAALTTLYRFFMSSMPSGLKGKTITVGIHCKASVVNQASLIVNDGVTTTRAGSTGNGTYHSGDGTDDWLYCTHVINASATQLQISLEVASAGTAYFGAGRISFGSIAAADWVPERWEWHTVDFLQAGTLTAPTTTLESRRHIFPFRAGLLERISIRVGTSPTGQNAIWDVNVGGTTAYGATKPFVLNGNAVGSDDKPDGTYANRCCIRDSFITVDCDQVGSGAAGADATIVLRFKTPVDEFAARFGF